MKRCQGHSPRHPADDGSHRLAFPVIFLGSLIVIALMLYVVDTAPLRTLVLAP
ncbi:MAG: hypothetical protein ACLQUZ_11330 [Rhizomicrobium sp.]